MKTIPENALAKLLVPNEGYDYFEGSYDPPFQPPQLLPFLRICLRVLGVDRTDLST